MKDRSLARLLTEPDAELDFGDGCRSKRTFQAGVDRTLQIMSLKPWVYAVTEDRWQSR